MNPVQSLICGPGLCPSPLPCPPLLPSRLQLPGRELRHVGAAGGDGEGPGNQHELPTLTRHGRLPRCPPLSSPSC